MGECDTACLDNYACMYLNIQLSFGCSLTAVSIASVTQYLIVLCRAR